MTTAIDDASAITQVIMKERQGRDRGWFAQEAESFHENSRVRITWFDGPGREFVRLSEATFGEGLRPSHRMATPVVHIDGDRSVAEIGAEISILDDFDGVEAYVVNYVRLLYRLTRIDGAWGISQLDCIYERDTLVPAIVGRVPELDPTILARFRRPYMYIGYHLHQHGKSMKEGLFGDDRPEEVDALYDEAFTWMREER